MMGGDRCAHWRLGALAALILLTLTTLARVDIRTLQFSSQWQRAVAVLGTNSSSAAAENKSISAAAPVTALAVEQRSLPPVKELMHPEVWSGMSTKHTGMGAWLRTKREFVKHDSRTVVSPEDATFRYANDLSTLSMQTLDVLDFMMVHLSPFSRLVGEQHRNEQTVEHRLLQHLAERLQRHTEELAELALQVAASEARPPQSSRTLLVVPYVSRAFQSQGNNALPIRKLFMNATLWAAGGWFPNLFLATCTESDAADAELLGPRFNRRHVVVMSQLEPNATCKRLYGWALTRARSFLAADVVNSSYDYVYFTEADQLLHLRHPDQLFKHLDADTRRVVIPHRLDAMPVLKGLDPDVAQLVESSSRKLPAIERWRYAEVVKLPLMRGSCCQVQPVWYPQNCFLWMPNCRPGTKEDLFVAQLGTYGLPWMTSDNLKPGLKDIRGKPGETRKNQPFASRCMPRLQAEHCNRSIYDFGAAGDVLMR